MFSKYFLWKFGNLTPMYFIW